MTAYDMGKTTAAILGGAAFILLLVTLRTLLGAVVGFIVGLFFSSPILGFFSQLDLNVTMWQLGATLGFISGFFMGNLAKAEK